MNEKTISTMSNESTIAQNLRLGSSLFGVMQAIEIAHRNGWHNLWLETDSMLVLLAFRSVSLVP